MKDLTLNDAVFVIGELTLEKRLLQQQLETAQERISELEKERAEDDKHVQA
jgi:hypothetical protein